MTTQNATTKWLVELYPFDQAIPNPLDFSQPPTPSVFGLIDSRSDIKKIVERLKTTGYIDGDIDYGIAGITSINFSRTKGAVDSQCVLSFVGQTPKALYAGTWIVITAVSTETQFYDKNIIKFIGQIHTISPKYSIDPSTGNTTLTTSVYAREWSSILAATVRYDILSIQAELLKKEGNLLAGAQMAANALGLSNDNDAASRIQKMVEQSFDPFELAHLILSYIGAINDNDRLSKAASAADDQFPEISVTMPSVPKALMARLKIQSGFGQIESLGTLNPKNPFQSGFVNVITGIFSDIYNDGSWNGIWDKLAIDTYKKIIKAKYSAAQDRPSTMGVGVLAQVGASAWDLIKIFCDGEVNEFYTDIWYEKDTFNDNGVIAKPVIVMRDKPYLLRYLKEKLSFASGNPSALDNFTVYDDLPRVYIPQSVIAGFDLNNTILNSPNCIRADCVAPGINEQTSKTQATINGIIRMDDEMRRFGGNTVEIKTTFIGKDLTSNNLISSFLSKKQDGTFMEKWAKKITLLKQAWDGYNYRQASGTLIIRDTNICISVGVNVQFNIGEFTLVGHVESFSTSHTVDTASGSTQTITSINLSHIVKNVDDQLLLFEPYEFSRFLVMAPKKPNLSIGGVSIDSITNIGGSFA